MALPKIKQPWYTTTLISNGKKVRFRPFTIGEQKKVMLTSAISQEDIDTYRATIEMVQGCVEGLNILDLYIVDFEKLFYDIRSVAEGNEITFEMPCKSDTVDKDGKPICQEKGQYMLNTRDDFKLVNAGNFEVEIPIEGSGIVSVFRQPKASDLLKIEAENFETEEQKIFSIMSYGLTSVKEKETVHSKFALTEAEEFINQLPQDCLVKITKFYQNTPSLECTKEFECTKCKTKFKITPAEVKSFLAQ